jgi:hypothetical protein
LFPATRNYVLLFDDFVFCKLQLLMSLITAKSIDASDIAIQYSFSHLSTVYIEQKSIVDWRYCNTIILMAAAVAINILLAAIDIAIQYIARQRYWNKYIGRSQNHQYNNNIIVRIPAWDPS